jgi:hypothetical protein
MKTKMLLMLMLFVAVLSASADAADVAIVNPGFEDPVLADGARQNDNATGWKEGMYPLFWGDPILWTDYKYSCGHINPDIPYAYNGIAPEGQNVMYSTAYPGYDQGLYQILSDTLQAGMVHRLSAVVGNPIGVNEGTPAPDYRLELVAGGVVVASTNDYEPGQGDPSPDPNTWGRLPA